jgi:hypothetical protein
MYLIIFIIIIILVGILFLRREHLTLEDLEKQIENAGPTLLSQYTRLQLEKDVKEAEAPAKPILESLQKSAGMEIIRKRRREQNINPNKPLTIDEGILIEGPSNIKRIKLELSDRGFFQAYNLNDEQLIKLAQQWGVNTSSPLQQIRDSTAEMREKLRKDDELMKKMEEDLKREKEERKRKFEESTARLIEKHSKRESVTSRLKRERREKTAARKKAQAEAEAKAKAEAEAKVRAEEEAKTKAQVEAKLKAESEAQEEAKAKARAKEEERARMMEETRAETQERIEQQSEEIAKIKQIRKEAEAAIEQLREIPLEERIRRKIFVQPKMVHKPYPFVRSTPANPPYETTKYEKRENLFETSEISSIFPRPIRLVYSPNT